MLGSDKTHDCRADMYFMLTQNANSFPQRSFSWLMVRVRRPMRFVMVSFGICWGRIRRMTAGQTCILCRKGLI